VSPDHPPQTHTLMYVWRHVYKATCLLTHIIGLFCLYHRSLLRHVYKATCQEATCAYKPTRQEEAASSYIQEEAASSCIYAYMWRPPLIGLLLYTHVIYTRMYGGMCIRLSLHVKRLHVASSYIQEEAASSYIQEEAASSYIQEEAASSCI
jgi:hypothetical protein